MRPQLGVIDQPVVRDLLRLVDRFEQVTAEHLLAIGLVETLDAGVLVGLPGLDEAQRAIQQGKRVRFYSVVDLVNRLDTERREGRAARLTGHLLHLDAIILDELGYLPFAQDGTVLLCHLISKLYERVSLIVTTNLTFGECGAACSATPR